MVKNRLWEVENPWSQTKILCPTSNDPFYIVNYYINGSLFLGHIVCRVRLNGTSIKSNLHQMCEYTLNQNEYIQI